MAQHTLTVQEIHEHAGYWGDSICDIVFVVGNLLHTIADNSATEFIRFPLEFIFKIQNESPYSYFKNPEPLTKYCHTETQPIRAQSTKANRYKRTF